MSDGHITSVVCEFTVNCAEVLAEASEGGHGNFVDT